MPAIRFPNQFRTTSLIDDSPDLFFPNADVLSVGLAQLHNSRLALFRILYESGYLLYTQLLQRVEIVFHLRDMCMLQLGTFLHLAYGLGSGVEMVDFEMAEVELPPALRTPSIALLVDQLPFLYK